jgi:hypothetical protein
VLYLVLRMRSIMGDTLAVLGYTTSRPRAPSGFEESFIRRTLALTVAGIAPFDRIGGADGDPIPFSDL